MTRYCEGVQSYPCKAKITMGIRCVPCGKIHSRIRDRDRKREMRNKPKPLTPAQIEWGGMTEAQRAKRIIDAIRWDVPAGEIAETYGITREEVRAINCAHYQRRARIAA